MSDLKTTALGMLGKFYQDMRGMFLGLKELKPDGISIGISLENTSMDCGYNVLRKMIEDVGLDIYLVGCYGHIKTNRTGR